MIDQFKLHIANRYNNFKGQKLLLAFSGGIDSTVLLELLHQSKIDFSIAHCNFGLREDASDADALFCEQIANQYQRPIYIKNFQTKVFAKEAKVSIQMAARELRYSWFDELKNQQGFTHILTAHHLDDQLETFMINLGRGSGLKGLRGIPSDKILRPLLSFSKDEIMQYALKNSVQWREDASNAKDDYLRNHLRHHIIPKWKESNENLLQQINQSLNHLSLAQEALTEVLDSFKKKYFIKQGNVVSITIESLKELKPTAYYLHALFENYGFHRADLESLLEAQSGKNLVSLSHRLIRDRDVLLLSPIQKDILFEEYSWMPIDNITKPVKLTLGNQTSNTSYSAVLDPSTLDYPLKLRKFQKGDYFYPVGMKGKKKLSKYFKDEKYTLLDKENQWLLCSKGQIVWVVGKRVDARFAANSDTPNPLIILSQ